MIWTTLALFVVSFLITALLAPEPKTEDQRPDEFDPNSFPRATEDDPVPLVLGRVRMRSPNTLWYGNFRTEPVVERIKYGIFPWQRKNVTVGYNYFLTLDLALCLGPQVNLRGIYIDDVLVWEGSELQFEPTDPIPLALDYEVGVPSPPRVRLDLLDFAPQDIIDIGGVSVGLFFSTSWTHFGLFGDGPAPQQTIISLRMENDAFASLENYGNASNNDVGGGAVALGGISVFEARYASYTATTVATFPLFSSLDVLDAAVVVSTIRAVDFCDFIDEPELFGGEKEGGGFVGPFCFYTGDFNQARDFYLEDLLTADGVPGYRGMSHIVFQDCNIGESPQLRKTSFDITAYSNNLARVNYGRITSTSDDINPAEAIYEISVSTWRGLSIPPAKIDVASFQSCATTLATEVNGTSVMVTSPQNGRDVITELLRQIDGVLYEEPSTGQITLKLIRDDYVPSGLDVYDEDDIVAITNFTKTTWEDVYSQVKVSFASRENDESGKVAVAQDMAVANMMGKLRTSPISFPFCYDPNLANQLAARELSRMSIPMFRCTIEMNRRAYDIRPGDVIKISWPEYGLVETIVRVQKYDLGELLNNKIILEVVQDVFAAKTAVFAAPVDSGWVSDRPNPMSVTIFGSTELPYFLNESVTFPAQEGYTNIVVMPRRPQTVSSDFTIASGLSGTALENRDPERVSYPVAFQVQTQYLNTAGLDDGLDATGITVNQVVGTLTAFTDAQNRNGEGLIFIGGEWLTYRGVTDNGGGSFTLANVRRAVLSTRPLTHNIGANGFVFDYSLLGDGSLGNLEGGNTAYFKILDSVGPTRQGLSSAVLRNLATVGLRDLPLRPRFLALEADRTPAIDVFPELTTLTWRASLRRADRVTYEDDAAETPDSAETYRLEVWIDGVQQVALDEASITSPFDIDFSAASGITGEVRLWAVRTSDSAESDDYAWLPFTLQTDLLLLSGDAQVGGSDAELLSGDAQTGTDKLTTS